MGLVNLPNLTEEISTYLVLYNKKVRKQCYLVAPFRVRKQTKPVFTRYQCVQDFICALSRVIPVKKPNPKLTESRRQWGSRRNGGNSLGWTPATDKNLVTPK